MKKQVFVLLFLLLTLAGVAQTNIYNWIKQLRNSSDTQFKVHYAIYLQLQKLDTPSRIKAAILIAEKSAGENRRLQLLGKSYRSKILFYNTRNRKQEYAAEMKSCLNEAIEMEEPYLQAEFGRWYSEMLNTLDQKELAVQYAITSLKLHEYLGFENFRAVSIFYLWVGETLLQTGYVPEAISYLQKGLQFAKTDTLVRPFRFMFTYNNLGLAYRELNRHDSALYYFEKLKNYCVQIKRPDWEQIAYKNRLPCFVELGMMDSAKVVVKKLFEISRSGKEPDDEMIAYEMSGRIALREKQYKTGIAGLLKSARVNGGRNQKLLARVNATLASTYEELGQPENAYPYLKALHRYQDSVNLEKTKYNSRFLAIKADYEKEQLQYRQLVSKAVTAIRVRNFGIALLVVLAFAGIFVLNKRRRKAQKIQQNTFHQLEKSKAALENKDQQVESLVANLRVQQGRQENSIRIMELSGQVILTEADWQHFKGLFEKSYPFFFSSLRAKAPGITEAEQRMAALLKIQLSTKQIASMQGISPDSVHKTRHRLRQRFATASTAELELIISEL